MKKTTEIAGSPSDSAQSAHFRIEGRVQGVGYRYWARSQARRLGLRGYVRNLPDGGVELVAIGPAIALDRMESLVATGPSGAYVQNVRRTPAAPELLDSFEIRY